VTEHNYCYCYLTYFGAKGAGTIVHGYWNKVDEMGIDRNPYRMGYLIPVGVSETDESAEAEYGKHIEYFHHKLLHMPERLLLPPGHMTHSSLEFLLKKRPFPSYDELNNYKYKYFEDNELLVTGSAATVVDKLKSIIKRLNVGNLMLIPQLESMPHEKAMENIDRIGKDVLPHIRDIWDDEGWENHWWPQNANPNRPSKRDQAA
jgi:hypothetical protein